MDPGAEKRFMTQSKGIEEIRGSEKTMWREGREKEKGRKGGRESGSSQSMVTLKGLARNPAQ